MSELKQIKRHHERQLKNMDKKLTMYQIHPADVDWLINRVEELEKQNERLTMLLNDKSYERDRSTVIIAQLQMELDKYKKMYEKGA